MPCLGRQRGSACTTAWIAILSLFVVHSLGRSVQAVENNAEVREFSITIDGRPSGQYRMTIARRDDGTVAMTGQASVLVKKVGVTVYHYTYAGTEMWKTGKDGQLLGMNSTSDDNGKKFEVQAAAEAGGLRVRVNGQPRLVRADVWTTTYWKLADARFHNQRVSLLDADTGKDYNGRLDYLGAEQLTVSGDTQTCHHFRVTGGPNPVDLWYDAQRHLVRQDFTEDGHRTIMQLVRVAR
jgi:hypothetical protein